MQRTKLVNKFINVRHGIATRLFVGVVLTLLTFVATFEMRLANEMFRRVFYFDQFRKAFRRFSFFARRSWLNINLSNDLVFVFCNDLSFDELLAMRRFLLKRQKKLTPGLIESDLCYTSAMLLMNVIGTEQYLEMHDLFEQDCNRVLSAIQNTPANFPVKHKEKGAESFDTASAVYALEDFSNFMKENEYPWFVLSGTLLGLVRENGFLKHDYDIDVGIMDGDVNLDTLLKNLRQDPRFRCDDLDNQVVFERDDAGHMSSSVKPVFLKISHFMGIHLDIFVHYFEGDTIWHASPLFRWDNSKFELRDYHLCGILVKGPVDANRYLTENYGDWRTPVVEFNSALDTTNQRIVQNPLSVAIFMRRVWLCKVSNPQAAQLLLKLLKNGGFVKSSNLDRYVFDPEAFSYCPSDR